MDTKEYLSSGIIESYILGHASPDEASIFECVMKNNEEVRMAYEEAQIILEDFATSQAIKPAPELKSKIWAKIHELENVAVSTEQSITENTKNEEAQKTYQEPINKAKTNWKTYAVAASVLFLFSLLGNLFWMNSQSENKETIAKLESEKQNQNQQLQELNQKWNILSNPDVAMVKLKGVETHPNSKATVFWNTNTKEVFLKAEDLPEAPEGMQYQLWAIADGKPVSAGMYSKEKDSKISLSNIQNAQAFAITLEKEGGSEFPTMENMHVMGEV